MRRTDEITNSEDIIDSRDVIARIEYLQDERETLVNAVDDAKDALNDYDATDDEKTEEEQDSELDELKEALAQAEAALTTFDEEEEGRELKALLALADEAEGYSPDWSYGSTLIRDSYFETYAQQFAEDCCEVNPNANWPFNHIDWKSAADELKQDYTSVDFDGVDYWVR